jgi:hypothetical protein
VGAVSDDAPLPGPGTRHPGFNVAPKLALYQLMRAAKISDNELARRIGVSEARCQRSRRAAHARSRAQDHSRETPRGDTRLIVTTEAAQSVSGYRMIQQRANTMAALRNGI